MSKTRTTLFLDEDLTKLARVKAVEEDSSLSNIVENALRNYLPHAMGVEHTAAGTTFLSGGTITTMKPTFTSPPGLGVPTTEEVLNSKPNTNEALGVPPLK